MGQRWKLDNKVPTILVVTYAIDRAAFIQAPTLKQAFGDAVGSRGVALTIWRFVPYRL